MFPFFKLKKNTKQDIDEATDINNSLELDAEDTFSDDELNEIASVPDKGTMESSSDVDLTYIDEDSDEALAQKDTPVSEASSELKDIALKHMNGEELTDEQLDLLADHCVYHIKHILAGFGCQDSKIDEYASENGEFIFDVINPELGSLIGHHGKTLEATQFLLNAILSQEFGFKYRVYLDVESYKSRQRTKLEQLARKSAARVRKEQRRIKLGFMSAYERRVVHMILNNEEGISTYSEGEDPYRRVVIIPKSDL